MKLLRYGNPGLSARGAYVLAEAEGKRQAILMATGTEVSLGRILISPVCRLSPMSRASGPVSARWVSLSALVSTMSTMLASLA